MENKLIEEIEKLVKSQNSFEITEDILTEKIFTLTSDVATKFGGWYYSQPLYKLNKLIPGFKDVLYPDQDKMAFAYFIEHIYKQVK